VTHNPSRKYFFAKLLGVVAAAGVLPKALAKPTVDAALPEKQSGAKKRFEVRHDERAVARRASV
jgi:hypothetical protein